MASGGLHVIMTIVNNMNCLRNNAEFEVDLALGHKQNCRSCIGGYACNHNDPERGSQGSVY